MAAAPKSTAVELPPMNIQTIDIPIIGESGLICHAWSTKAKRQMLDKQMKKAAVGKVAKDPWADFCETLYWLSDKPEEPTEDDVMNGRFGFPAVAFKSAAITAVTSTGGMTKVLARQASTSMGSSSKSSALPRRCAKIWSGSAWERQTSVTGRSSKPGALSCG